MRMEKYSNAAYGSAGLTAFFASLSLYEWGFIIGMALSVAKRGYAIRFLFQKYNSLQLSKIT
ncbi:MULTISPECIES: hypothetical protein [Providencia]|uniref:hypothetical protein n=1 Tax=Providencia TaxID=586 RepID=UPI00234BBB64|nr:hypothetical protein [Providencia sp. PROV148]